MRSTMMFTSFLFLILTQICFAQKQVEIHSPDKQLGFRFRITESSPQYQIEYKKTILIDYSELSLLFKDDWLSWASLTLEKPQFKIVNETYELVVGKTKVVHQSYREVLIPFVEAEGLHRKINLVVRVYNDGIGFRYEFPEQENWKSYILVDENSSFAIKGNPVVNTLLWKSYNNNHEGLYRTIPYDKLSQDSLMDLPVLFEYPNKVYMAITEANLRDYAGMYLQKEGQKLVSRLSPLPGQAAEKVRANLPHRTPWRVIMISDRIGALIESNILTNLNDPSVIEDPSWIKPGKTSFHWWNGDILPDTTIVPGVNFETNKYYIDFCARHKIEYHAVIGYGGFAWFPNNWKSYGEAGSYSDLTRSVSSLDMGQICQYAKSKGVAINVWVHWQALYPQLEDAFTQFEKWGIKGMMVDFLDRDDQEMVKISEEILQCAAKHHLYIQFHGAYKPTGLHRTYPNEFTREGTHNYEQNKWSIEPISPDHDLEVVFTRMLAGATDYHLGGFRAVPKNEFRTQYTRPLMSGTRCHMMAMYVVLESYLEMVADFPSAYVGEPGFEFICKVPTTWDQTVVPAAEIREYAVVARRKGDDWFVGAINSSTARDLDLSFDFLDSGRDYQVILYQDSPDVDRYPNRLDKLMQKVDKESHLRIQLAAGGGMVMELTPVDQTSKNPQKGHINE